MEDGLPQQSVQCLLQSRDGYLWCGTWFGLARFDGVQFTVFDRQNTPPFAADDTISALAEDAGGRLWIGTKRGLVVREGRVFSRAAVLHATGDVRVTALAPAADGGMWAGTSAGLYHCSPGTNRLMGPPPGMVAGPDQSHFRALGAMPSGRLMVLGAYRLHEFDPASGRYLPLGPELNASQPTDVAVRGESVWLAHFDGLERVIGSRVERVFANVTGQAGRLQKVLARRDGSVWFTTADGKIFRRDEGGTRQLEFGKADLAGIASLLEDTEGNVWFGTEAGLLRLRSTFVHTFTTREGLSGNNVWTVSPASDGGVWVGTDRGAAHIAEAAGVGPVIPTDSAVRAILEDPSGLLWFGQNYGGVYSWQHGHLSGISSAHDARTLEPRALLADRRGSIWVGTGSGVGRVESERLAEWWSRTNGLPAGTVRVIHQDRAGALWFGVNGAGLVRLAGGRLEVFDQRQGLRDLRPTVIHETPDGALWVGTEGGLHRFAAGQAFAFTTEHGLAENLVNCILEDGAANLWLSGLRGIHRVRRAELEAVARGERSSVRCDSLGGADGIENPETNGENQPAGCRTPDGRLWFPTAGGLVVFDARAADRNDSPAPTLIESVTMDGEPIVGEGLPPRTARVELAPRRAQVVRVAYTAPTTGDAARIRFRHRLRGLDDRWHEVGNERVAYFTNLRPGDYAFEVEAGSTRGDWQPPASFAFSLAPAFVQTVWFPVAAGAALVLFVGGLAALRLRWQHQALQAEHATALAEERTRIADDLHDELGGSLTEIGVFGELAERHAAEPAQVSAHARRIKRTAAELAEAADEIVWSLNPRHDRTEKFAAYLGGFSERFLESSGLACHWDLPVSLPSLPMRAEMRHELFLLVKEALHNAVKHARATGVRLRLRVDAGGLNMEISDNGVGFDPKVRAEAGNGLASMRRRAEKLGGEIFIRSAPGSGTLIEVQVPLPPTEPNGP